MSAPSSNAPLLPTYEPSAPSPDYTHEPTSGEQTLQQTPSLNIPRVTGTYVEESNNVVVTLFDQEKDAVIPKYGRQDLIDGTMVLENTELIYQVIVKIEGKLESSCYGGGYKSMELLNDCHPLWKKGSEPEDKLCPSLLPFSCVLPATYNDGDRKSPLPPSYASRFADPPSMFVKCHYSINIYVERFRHPKIGFLTATKHIVIPFEYYPRTRAHRPILASLGFFSSVKTSPEEWYQVLSEMKTPPNSQIDPVYCHLFLPAALIYGLKDTIPFHVQLSGPLRSIKKFLLLPENSDTGSEPNHSMHSPLQWSSGHKPTITIVLLRQLSVTARGHKASGNIILAEGQLHAVPPALTSCESQDTIHLDWEGEMKCNDNVSVGSFVAGNVTVKDFIGLGVEPPKHRHMVSAFRAVHMTVAIKLVTDSYIMVTDYGDQL